MVLGAMWRGVYDVAGEAPTGAVVATAWLEANADYDNGTTI